MNKINVSEFASISKLSSRLKCRPMAITLIPVLGRPIVNDATLWL